MKLEEYAKTLDNNSRITWVLFDRYMRYSYLYSMSIKLCDLKNMCFWKDLRKNEILKVIKNGNNVLFKLRSIS